MAVDISRFKFIDRTSACANCAKEKFKTVKMASFGTDQPATACESPISDFFRDKCVFLTGCTGFLGQLYLEKLLR